MIQVYGSEKTYALSTSLTNYRDISEIRANAINASLVVILDDAVERVPNLNTLIKFLKTINPNIRLLLLYENRQFEVYSELFDASYRLPMYSVDNNTLTKALSNTLERDTLLTKVAESHKVDDTDYSLPKTLPDTREELVDIINDLSNKIMSMQSTLRYQNKELLEARENMHKLHIYSSSMVQKLQRTEANLNEMLLENRQLREFKDLISVYQQENHISAFTHRFKTDKIFIHIKDVDGFLMPTKFLDLLLTKVEMELGLPTKLHIIDKDSTYASYTDLYTVNSVFDKYKMSSSNKVVKVGYSKEYMEEIEDDASNPKCIIIFNKIGSLDIEAKNISNYFAVKGSPDRYTALSQMKDYVITNYPDTPMSFAYDTKYKEMQANEITSNYQISSNVFRTIISHVKHIKKSIERSRVEQVASTEM